MPDVELLFGPPLLGVFLNCILYGTVLIQILVYFQTYKRRDPLWIRSLVYYLLFCETANTVCDIGTVYEPLIVRYGTPHATTYAPIMLVANPLLTVMISTPVQIFLAWRVKILSQSNVLFAIIVVLAMASFAGGIATAIAMILCRFKYSGFHTNDFVTIIWLGSSATADIIITASMVYHLMGHRTGFASTDDLINRIIRMTVQTGLITSVAATVDLAFFMAAKKTALNFVFDFPLSKLYSNSLLSTLNARGGLAVTSSIDDPVLFRNGVEDTSTQNSLTQVCFATSHGTMRSVTLPEVFDSGSDSHNEDSGSATTVSAKFASEV